MMLVQFQLSPLFSMTFQQPLPLPLHTPGLYPWGSVNPCHSLDLDPNPDLTTPVPILLGPQVWVLSCPGPGPANCTQELPGIFTSNNIANPHRYIELHATH